MYKTNLNVYFVNLAYSSGYLKFENHKEDSDVLGAFFNMHGRYLTPREALNFNKLTSEEKGNILGVLATSGALPIYVPHPTDPGVRLNAIDIYRDKQYQGMYDQIDRLFGIRPELLLITKPSEVLSLIFA